RGNDARRHRRGDDRGPRGNAAAPARRGPFRARREDVATGLDREPRRDPRLRDRRDHGAARGRRGARRTADGVGRAKHRGRARTAGDGMTYRWQQTLADYLYVLAEAIPWFMAITLVATWGERDFMSQLAV